MNIKNALPLILAGALPLSAALISDVRSKISAGDLSSADAIAEDYRRTNGVNSEYADAIAWLARGASLMKDNEAVSRYLSQAKSLDTELLKTKRVEEDGYLEAAVGGTIEVEAHALAEQGHRDRAVAFLETELSTWKTWQLQSRIYKNLNLLTLEGKPAPDLDPKDRGKPILLFLWAHWCGDCKAQVPAIGRIRERYQPRGLLVIAPTRRYGAVPKIENPTPEQEDKQIEQVWKESYSVLTDTAHPITHEMMLHYGVSSTPTLVLIDRKGIVRLYLPSRMSEAELGRRIESIL